MSNWLFWYALKGTKMTNPRKSSNQIRRDNKHLTPMLGVETLESLILLSGTCGGFAAHSVSDYLLDTDTDTHHSGAGNDAGSTHSGHGSGESHSTHHDPLCDHTPPPCKPVSQCDGRPHHNPCDKPDDKPPVDDFDSILELEPVYFLTSAWSKL